MTDTDPEPEPALAFAVGSGEARRPVLEPVARREPTRIHRSRDLGRRRADRRRLAGRRRYRRRRGGERGNPTLARRSRVRRDQAEVVGRVRLQPRQRRAHGHIGRPGAGIGLRRLRPEARGRGAVLEVVARLQPARAHRPVQRRRRRGHRRGLPRRGQRRRTGREQAERTVRRARRVRRDHPEPVVRLGFSPFSAAVTGTSCSSRSRHRPSASSTRGSWPRCRTRSSSSCSSPPGLTVPFSVADVEPTGEACPVVASVAAPVVNRPSAPFVVPDEFVATTRNQ